MSARKRLLALIDETGGVAAMAEKTGVSESMFFHVLNGRRQFGKSSALKIERAFPGRIDSREIVWIGADSDEAVA